MFERLGHFVSRRRKAVFLLFLLGILIAGGLGSQAFSRFDSGGYNDPRSDSAKATQYLKETFDVKDPSLVFAVSSRDKTVDDPEVVASAQRLESKLLLIGHLVIHHSSRAQTADQV